MLGIELDLPLVSWERRNGKENGNYYDGLYRDYYKDPFLLRFRVSGLGPRFIPDQCKGSLALWGMELRIFMYRDPLCFLG